MNLPEANMQRSLRIFTFLAVGGATIIATSLSSADEQPLTPRPTNVRDLPDAKAKSSGALYGLDGAGAKKTKPKDADTKKGDTKAKAAEPVEAQPVPEPQSPPAAAAPPEPAKDAPATAEQKPKDEKEDHPISIAAVVGTAGHDMGLGVGLRGGYTLPQHIYFGGVFAYHFGKSSGD